MNHYVCAAFMLIQFIVCSLSYAQVSDFEYRIDRVDIHSEILNETHTVSVYLPPDYEQNKESYPVFYVLESIYAFLNAISAVHGDGKMSTTIPEMIVVGVNTSDRWRDLSPSFIPDWHGYPIPQSGGGANYLAFLEKEVIPKVDSTYRTHPFRVLYGHSLGGLFTLFSLVEKPELFSGYIASSPNLEYDQRIVTQKAKAITNASIPRPRFVFLNSDNDADDYAEEISRFTTVIDERGLNVEYTFKDYIEHDHWNVPRYSLGDGLRFVFKDYTLPDSAIARGANAIEGFYDALSLKYGFQVKPMGGYINFLSMNLLREDRLNEAIDMLEYNTRLYPDYSYVYERLGDALLQAERIEEARAIYQRALSLDPENQSLLDKRASVNE